MVLKFDPIMVFSSILTKEDTFMTPIFGVLKLVRIVFLSQSQVIIVNGVVIIIYFNHSVLNRLYKVWVISKEISKTYIRHILLKILFRCISSSIRVITSPLISFFFIELSKIDFSDPLVILFDTIYLLI